jgi:hypothetical protein
MRCIKYLVVLATLVIAGCQPVTPQSEAVLSDKALQAANQFRAGTMTRDDAQINAEEFVRARVTRPKVIEFLGPTRGGRSNSIAYTIESAPRAVVLDLEIENGVVSAGHPPECPSTRNRSQQCLRAYG